MIKEEIEKRAERFVKELKAAMILAHGNESMIDELKVKELYSLLLPNGIELNFYMRGFDNRTYFYDEEYVE